MKQQQGKLQNVIDAVRLQCQHEFYIEDHYKLDACKKEIEQFEEDEEEYVLVIDFENNFDSLYNKIDVMNMLTELEVDQKVAKIVIKINNDSSKYNEQIFETMIAKYQNLHSIHIIDDSDQLDTNVHDLVQKYVSQQQVLLDFKLSFEGELADQNGAFQLMKHYNQLLKDKWCLEQLHYKHDKLDGLKNAYSIQEVQDLINIVDNK